MLDEAGSQLYVLRKGMGDGSTYWDQGKMFIFRGVVYNWATV